VDDLLVHQPKKKKEFCLIEKKLAALSEKEEDDLSCHPTNKGKMKSQKKISNVIRTRG